MSDLHAIPAGFRFVRDFGLSIFGLSGTHLYKVLRIKERRHAVLMSPRILQNEVSRTSDDLVKHLDHVES